METAYDAASNAIQVTTRQRYHNATGVGPLGSPSSAQPQARVTYAANWPDALGRAVATADYGTNGGTALSRPQTTPASSTTVLVSLTAYNNDGTAQSTTDPMGTVTCFSYDAAGREVQRILNYRAISSSSSSSGSSASSAASSSSSGVTGPCPASADTNVTVLTAYNPDSNVVSVTAVNSVTGNQVTQYVYGTTLPTSGVASSLLKVADVYPDSVSGSDSVQYTYNRQGQVTTLTDQNGTVHSYVYDLLGRQTQDCVTTAGTDVDTAVLRIESAYEVRGLVSGVTSYDNATVGSGNVVNDVQLRYNTFSQLIADYQSHSGAAAIGTTPAVQYTYGDGTANTIRPTSMIYPDTRVLTYDYGQARGLNDALSRIESLIDNDAITSLARYSYLGTTETVQVAESQSGLTYTLLGLTSGNDPVTGDIYQGLDTFGRIKDLIWTAAGGNSATNSSSSSGAPAVVERIQHAYDFAGNRLWRRELADPSHTHDELYAYDGLHRLKNLQRGTLSAGQTAVTPETFAQCWAFDATGNWQTFQADENGDGVWEQVQSRASNQANEITAISTAAGSPWVTPAYNLAGSVATMPQPVSPTQSYGARYDAWNRLVSLNDGTAPVQVHEYDGMRRRIVQLTYSEGVVSETRHFYNSHEWQIVEERFGTSLTATRQFVWGARYIDDLVLRDRDTTGSGLLNERLYSAQDANWNVLLSVNTSGIPQERYVYEPYGRTTVLLPSFVAISSSQFDWEICYAGYYWAGDVGLYFVRNRVLHPGIGVFLTRDPNHFDPYLGDNLYAYANANPVNLTDPMGLVPILPPIGLGVRRCTPRDDQLCKDGCRQQVCQFQGPGFGKQRWTEGYCIRVLVFRIGGRRVEARECQCDLELPPPGDCELKDYQALNAAVRTACKKKDDQDGVPICNEKMGEKELRRNATAWRDCAEARVKLMVKCFRGGDLTHAKAVQFALAQSVACAKLALQKAGVGQQE